MREEGNEPRRYFGKYKGYVRRNDDPEGRARVMAFCPQVMGPEDDEQHWLGWAEACLPWVGGLNTLDFGSPHTKEQNGGVEVGVWLEFEGGLVDFPIWVGTFIPAPTRTDKNAQLDLENAAALPGGSILSGPPPGSSVGALNPPKPIPGADEVRLYAKEGRDIIIGVQGGGCLVLGPSGAHLTGVQVSLNGRVMEASTTDSVTG